MSRSDLPSRRTIVVLALGLLVAGLVARGDPSWLETTLFQALHDLPEPLGGGLQAIAPLGSGLAVLAVPLLLAIFDRDAAWEVWLSGGLAWLAANLLKLVVDRPRPEELFDLPALALDGSGFPSGHTAVAVAIVTGLWPWLTRTGQVIAVVLAAGVGLSRIELGAHMPLDVIGGALLGLLMGIGVRAVRAGSRH